VAADARAIAALNNAHWCAAVCHSHEIPNILGERIWTSLRPSPPFYPDAVTLHPEAGIGDLDLRRGGFAVKDSFAGADLGPHGFVELFTAQWIQRPAGAPIPAAGLRVEPVVTAAGLTLWGDAWGQGADDIFRPTLLTDPAVRVLGLFDDASIAGGAVLNQSAGAVGVSNVFSTESTAAAVWASVIAYAARNFPGLPLVGYEHGDDLEPALAAGFAELGPLRVWVQDHRR